MCLLTSEFKLSFNPTQRQLVMEEKNGAVTETTEKKERWRRLRTVFFSSTTLKLILVKSNWRFKRTRAQPRHTNTHRDSPSSGVMPLEMVYGTQRDSSRTQMTGAASLRTMKWRSMFRIPLAYTYSRERGRLVFLHANRSSVLFVFNSE